MVLPPRPDPYDTVTLLTASEHVERSAAIQRRGILGAEAKKEYQSTTDMTVMPQKRPRTVEAKPKAKTKGKPKMLIL